MGSRVGRGEEGGRFRNDGGKQNQTKFAEDPVSRLASLPWAGHNTYYVISSGTCWPGPVGKCRTGSLPRPLGAKRAARMPREGVPGTGGAGTPADGAKTRHIESMGRTPAGLDRVSVAALCSSLRRSADTGQFGRQKEAP